jgi:hypothetical protein
VLPFRFFIFSVPTVPSSKFCSRFSAAPKIIFRTCSRKKQSGRSLIHSEWFLDSFYRVRRCRDVSHYSQELMEKIFKRHHFAAVISIFIVYLFLLLVGFFIDYPFFSFRQVLP